MISEFFLAGRIPSKKNSKRVCRLGNGKITVISSKDYLEWEKKSVSIIKIATSVRGIESCSIFVAIKFPDRRKQDLSNKFEGIADALVKAGVLIDDNFTVLHTIQIKHCPEMPEAGALVRLQYD